MFCNFYQYYIWHFSKLAKLFTDFIKKYTLFNWILACQSAFDSLKKIVIKALILIYYKPSLKTIIKINFSDNLNSAVFFQIEEDELLYPATFFSKNLNSIECNYKIYNKE